MWCLHGSRPHPSSVEWWCKNQSCGKHHLKNLIREDIMEREDCYMTFSEALEEYLDKREVFNSGGNIYQSVEQLEEDMKVASDHMDALTSFIPHVHGTRQP